MTWWSLGAFLEGARVKREAPGGAKRGLGGKRVGEGGIRVGVGGEKEGEEGVKMEGEEGEGEAWSCWKIISRMLIE